jgi:T5SS/PEP-CTERM-associated repeat protein
VTIRNGGTGDSGFTSLGGAGGTGHSTLNVEGAGSLWTGHSIYMGGSTRTASLNITAGGSVLAEHFYCAQGNAACDVTISGAGSSLDATHDVFIGQVGPAVVTLDEGGIFTVGNLGAGLDVSNTGTLVFGIGNGSKIACTTSAVIDNGATIVVKLDNGFTPTLGVPHDLITASAGLSADINNLVLDISAIGAGYTAELSKTASALQVTLTGPPTGTIFFLE